jgi:hypothetical protein
LRCAHFKLLTIAVVAIGFVCVIFVQLCVVGSVVCVLSLSPVVWIHEWRVENSLAAPCGRKILSREV